MRTLNLTLGLLALTAAACFAAAGVVSAPLGAAWLAYSLAAAVSGARAGRLLGKAIIGPDRPMAAKLVKPWSLTETIAYGRGAPMILKTDGESQTTSPSMFSLCSRSW